MTIFTPHKEKGFTLAETVVSLGIFIILLTIVYQTTGNILRGTKNYRDNAIIAGLASQFQEVARNLPYSQVGTLNGNPRGSLPDLLNATTTTVSGTTYQIYYEVTYIDDPADGLITLSTDPAPNDYKQVKLTISNLSTGIGRNFVTSIAPKGLEDTTSSGALFIKVFDSVGQPIPGASVNITNSVLSPSINLSRTTDSTGNWIEVGLPNSVNSYHVSATASGNSTDQTHPISNGNPNPTKPNATIANGQVTQISFSIDKLSNLTFNTLNQLCQPIANVGVRVKGAKLIGTPDVLKFDNSYISDGSGIISLPSIEWDNYTPSLIGNTYMIYGSSPIQQISLLPNTSQTFTLILGPKTANSLLVIVKDGATGNPIENANVNLQTITPFTETHKLTGGSVWGQQDWSGGAGQNDFTDPTRYESDDGNITTTNIPLAVRLNTLGPSYLPSGVLTSSTFDTGTASSSYTTLNWQPTSQDPATSLKFQIATNNDNSTWNYIGPDGTAATFYTVPGTTISTTNNNSRYLRYRAYFSTTDPDITPVLTSTSINYIAGCFTPGQVIFTNLAAGPNYNLVVSATGYTTQTIPNLDINDYNVLQVLLN